MNKENQLISLCKEMYEQICHYQPVIRRDEILSYVGLFGEEVDGWIRDFYKINTQISEHGGSPVLKKIIVKLGYYEIRLVKETACLMLEFGAEIVDCVFINQMVFQTMTTGEIIVEAQALAKKNNVKEYAINVA